jgi:hypothetical protein
MIIAYPPDKRQRFEAFYLEEAQGTLMANVPNQMMKGSQLRQEKEEFSKVKSQYDATLINPTKYETYSTKNVAKVEVKEKPWKPERLLLLRFGIKKVGADDTIEVKRNSKVQEKIATGDSYFQDVALQYSREQVIQEEKPA